MTVRTWLIDKLGGVPAQEAEQLVKEAEERGGFEVVIEARNANRENAGGIVTAEGAMKLSAVLAGTRVLSETLASVPLHWYEHLSNGGRNPADDYYLANVFESPNPFQTSFDFTELLMKCLVLWGNFYAQIEYDTRGRVVELWPLPPQNFISSRIDGNRRLYQYQDSLGRIKTISSAILWHVHGLGNGLDGDSIIGLMRSAARLGLSAEEFGLRFFENDARPGIVLEHPGKLGDQAHKHLRESYEEEHKGVSKSHRIEVLEEGMKLHEVGIPPEDAQFLETRKFQVTEFARVLRIPPHMIGDLEHATFSNIEHLAIEFVKFTMMPWTTRIEASIKKHLMFERDRLRFYPKYLLAGLERGDISNRYSAYAVARQNGWMSANDIRRLEDMNPIENGDMYLVPLNMVPADQVGQMNSTEPAPTAPVDTARSLPVDREERTLRSARTRHRLAQAHKRVILDVAGQVMHREVEHVGNLIHKHLAKRDTGLFLMRLDEFYKEHADFMTLKFLPIFMALAESIAAEAMDEVAAETDLLDRLERFVHSYTGSFAAQQTGISLYRLKNALQDALNSDADPEQALTGELNHWQEVRPGEISTEQSTRCSNAVAKMVFAAVGISSLRWVTIGENCPYCNRLDGKTISIYKNFLNPGEKLEADGAEPLTTTTDIGHPPAHAGCDCVIVAG